MNYASPVSRFFALVIDAVILTIVNVIISFILGLIGIGDSSVFFFGSAISFILGVLYYVYFLSSNNGQTPGKQMLGIRVVDASGGGSISAMQAGLRYIGYFISTFLFMLGWLLALVDSRKQALHDKLAGTVVVNA